MCIYIHTYIYTHTLFFSYYLLSCSITSDWIEFPVLYSRTSLLIHSKCNGLQLLTQTPSPSHQCPCIYLQAILSPCGMFEAYGMLKKICPIGSWSSTTGAQVRNMSWEYRLVISQLRDGILSHRGD